MARSLRIEFPGHVMTFGDRHEATYLGDDDQRWSLAVVEHAIDRFDAFRPQPVDSASFLSHFPASDGIFLLSFMIEIGFDDGPSALRGGPCVGGFNFLVLNRQSPEDH